MLLNNEPQATLRLTKKQIRHPVGAAKAEGSRKIMQGCLAKKLNLAQLVLEGIIQPGAVVVNQIFASAQS